MRGNMHVPILRKHLTGYVENYICKYIVSCIFCAYNVETCQEYFSRAMGRNECNFKEIQEGEIKADYLWTLLRQEQSKKLWGP